MADLTLEQSASLTAGASMWTTVSIPQAGIGSLRMADGPMGVAGSRVDERDVAVLTPAPVALGATWDRDLVCRIGALIGSEARNRDIQLMLAPNINLARSPLAGRAFEYFSEDPFLTGILGACWIDGLQSLGVGAVAKHLVCNDSETDRNTVNSVVDQRTLREVYLLPFELAAAARCAGMLTGYNKVNGVTCSEARQVITDIVKGEWGFPGLVMSDWFGTHSTEGCLNGGLDLEMPGPARYLGAKTIAVVEAGQAAEARVTDAARRVAATAARFGAPTEALTSENAEAVLRDAAAASFTLVRNIDGALPIDPGSVRRLAVIGPNATSPCFQGGTFAKIALRADAVTPLAAIEKRFGGHCEVLHAPGVDPQPRLPRLPATPSRDIGDGCTTGFTVDYYPTQAAGAQPAFTETRDTNSLTWFLGVHEAGAYQQAAMTRASGRFTARQSGLHTIYVGGTGGIRLLIDGVETFERRDEVVAADVMGRLKSGEADSVQIVMEAGGTVELVFELRYQPARVQGLWFGVRGPETGETMLRDAVELASKADRVILIVGETSDASVESRDRSGTEIDAAQIRLIEAITEANPRTVIVANVGHAFDTSWEERAEALLLTWYPGEQYGAALAAVLAGDEEPGGRMPVTIARKDSDYPAFDLKPSPDGDLRYDEGTLIGYRAFAARNIVPRHALGSGQGYAQFALSDARWEDGEGGTLRLSVAVRNLSMRAGAEVVQVYRDAPELALVGFKKVRLSPGEEERVFITLSPKADLYWNEDWQKLPSVNFFVGRASNDLTLNLAFDRPN